MKIWTDPNGNYHLDLEFYRITLSPVIRDAYRIDIRRKDCDFSEVATYVEAKDIRYAAEKALHILRGYVESIAPTLTKTKKEVNEILKDRKE